MKRRINHTGKRKLNSNEYQIVVTEESNGSKCFDVELKLDREKLPADARVYVEAYYRDTLQRFDFGMVGDIRPPKNRVLNEIDLSGPTLFRIKVVDETGGIGKILAVADKVRAKGDLDEEDRSHLLVVKSRPMAHQIWRLEFNTGGFPELSINSRIPDGLSRLKQDPVFQALILPAVLREVLIHYLCVENGEGFDEGETDAARQWREYAEDLHIPLDEGDQAARLQWVDEVVARFCETFSMCDRMLEKLGGGAA